MAYSRHIWGIWNSKKSKETPRIVGLILWIYLISLFSLNAQDLSLTRQVIPQKISTRSTRIIHEDQFGFIWYGASDLYKYDGNTSKRFRAVLEDSTVVSFGGVYDILEESNGDLFLATAKGLFLYERESNRIIPMFRKKLIDRFGDVANIQAVCKDRLGRFWLAGTLRLFLINDIQKGDVQIIREFSVSAQSRNYFKAFNESEDGSLFVASYEGLLKIDKDLSSQFLLPEEDFAPGESFFVSDIQKGNKDTLWLGAANGLWVFETGPEKFTPIRHKSTKEEYVRALVMDDQGRLWFATLNEIMVRYPNGEFREVVDESYHSVAGVLDLLKDRKGNIWTGGHNGITLLDIPLDERIPFYRIGGNWVNQDNFFFRMMQDSSGGYWFRMFSSGLGYSQNLDGPFEIVLQPPLNASSGGIKDFCTDRDGNVWVITFSQGLYLFENGGPNYKSIYLGDSILISDEADIIYDEQDGQLLWISTSFGLCSVDRFTFQHKWYFPKNDLPWLELNAVSAMFQSSDGTIWCNLHIEGNNSVLGYFDKKSGRFNAQQNPASIPEIFRVRDMLETPDNKIWVTTNAGLIIVDMEDKSLSFLGPKEGLPFKVAKSIVLDKFGNLWITSGNKLCKYDGEQFECFRHNSAVGGFIYDCGLLNEEGKLVFCGSKGQHIFDPAKPKRDSLVPKVYLTGFKVFNKEKDIGKAPELVKDIKLTYDEKVFTFSFSAPHFVGKNKIKYKYKLEGFVDEWTESGNEQQVTYTNLSPGKYTFKVIAASWNDIWTNEEQGLTVNLSILPPWYRTWWAYGSYVLLISGLLFGFYQFQLSRKLAEAEANRQKEMHQTKSKLFTNITHEFRTPLTVILGMADQVKSDPENWFNEGLQLIRRNGQQLLGLVNQLLDLSKLESGAMALNLVNGDIVSFLNYLIESFHSYADGKDIRLHFLSDFKNLKMDYDPDKLQQVISNLLSNAIKFTPAGGDVYLEIRRDQHDPEQVRLLIKDNGIGISSEHLSHIFDRFYQVDATTTRMQEGSGIGLALTKELVQLMDGTIKAESEVDEGTSFLICLPIKKTAQFQEPVVRRKNHLTVSIPDIKKSVENESYVKMTNKPIVLLVEDNADVITYLNSFLSAEYEVEVARNGKIGIERAIELVPDLIVSDVMMPEKDGFEVCSFLKQDERTSHIPIILLTAKSDHAAKLEGLSHGADAYLAKPFNKEELMIRIEHLIQLRKKLKTAYQGKDYIKEIVQKKQPGKQDLFLQKVIQIVEEHISDENFGLPELCKKVYLSRSQLSRKLKALTDKSITHFIRSIRLARASELLLNSNKNANEIAYEVGFRNPTYFSKTFKEEFGKTPGEYRNT